VGACTEQAEDEDGYSKEEKTAYLTTAFCLPARCCGRSGLLHEVEIVGFSCC